MRASPRFALGGLAMIMVTAACGQTPDLQFGDDEGLDAGADVGRVPIIGGGASDASRGTADAAPPTTIDASRPPATPDAGPSPVPDAAAPIVDAGPVSVPDAATPPPPPPPPPVDAGPPPEVDAGPVLACPGTLPAGADLCCGSVPCVGKKCAAVCSDCAACAGRVCCALPNGKSAVCATSTGTCPKGSGKADLEAEVSPD